MEAFWYKAEDAICRFPHYFDARLHRCLDRLIANASDKLLQDHTFQELKRLLLVQFFLQKKMEQVLPEQASSQCPFFLRLFRRSTSICMAFVSSSNWIVSREQFLSAFRTFLPGIVEIPSSFFSWIHPEKPYSFTYLEVQKMRGEELPIKELKAVEKALKETLLAVPPLTPALFWPYNEEESYRQVRLLQGAIDHPKDMPHLSIQFQEQSPNCLVFLVHFSRPQQIESVSETLKSLPLSVHCRVHWQQVHTTPFPIEVGVLSFQVPPSAFDIRGSINLLYARRYVMKCLELIFGNFRDHNGGLFERQQQCFESLRVHLSDQIPYFDIFAEKLFYALHPVEKRLSLSLEEAKEWFFTFVKALESPEEVKILSPSEKITISKMFREKEPVQDSQHSAQITLGEFHYRCLFDEPKSTKQPTYIKKTKTLRLCFQEGAPLSLNPHHSSGDMRCRILGKLLFEGLTRLDPEGTPELAGARSLTISDDSLVYRFALRPSHWSNGEKVTAVDYVTAWKGALHDRISHPEHFYIIKNGSIFREGKLNSYAMGIRAIDSETLEVELESPDPLFLYKLAQPIFFPLFGSLREPKWFNGPYLLREYKREMLLLEKNPYYWNAKELFFEQIEIRWIDDVELISSLFHKNQIDWVGDPLNTLSPQMIADFHNQGRLFQQKAGRRFFLFFNTRVSPLSNRWIRYALSLSIDRKLLCETIFPFSFPCHPLIPNKEHANACFERGLQELGMKRSDFPILCFTYSHQVGREELALALQHSWKQVLRVEIHLEKTEWNLFRKNLEKGGFEIMATIQEQGEDSLEFFSRFEGESSWNFSQWKSPVFRELLQKKEGKDLPETIALAKEMLEKQAPFSPLFQYTHLFSHSPYLTGYRFDKEGCIDFSQAKLKTNGPLP